MEKEMNQNEERLLELMETKAFTALSATEKKFVLTMTFEEEYVIQYQLMQDSADFDDDLEPKALILPAKKRRGVVIPLYQTIGAVVAAVVISFFVFRSNDIVINEVEGPKIASVDTVFVELASVDTVFDTEIQYVDRIVYRNGKCAQREPKQLFAQSSVSVPEINLDDISSNSASIKQDETFVLVSGSIPVVSDGMFNGRED
jgi:hypothetical protein